MSAFVRSDMKENFKFHSLLGGGKHLKHSTKLREEHNQRRPAFGGLSHILKCYWSAGIFLGNFVTFRRTSLWEERGELQD